MMHFLKHLAYFSLLFLRYLVVTLFVMFALISLMTGKFPPPLKEIAQNIYNMQSSMDLAKATANIAQARKAQESYLQGIEQGEISKHLGFFDSEPEESPQQLKQKNKALNYELALAKSKLYRLEAEIEELRTKK